MGWASQAIREFDAKRMFTRWIHGHAEEDARDILHSARCCQVRRHPTRQPVQICHPPHHDVCVCVFVWIPPTKITEGSDMEALAGSNGWLKEHSLVAKPDQLIKRRGKLGLICLNKQWAEVMIMNHHPS